MKKKNQTNEFRRKYGKTLCENGRSIVEMLGVLAVMGILTVTTVIIFRLVLNKNKATTLVLEGKMAFMEATARQSVSALNTWQAVSFTPSYGVEINTKRDYLNHDYVLIKRVPKEICTQMLLLQAHNVLDFYTPEGEEKTSCTDENDIILAFNGFGKVAECLATKDCGQDFNGICNSENLCTECENLKKKNT